jgi:hypothetical protein
MRKIGFGTALLAALMFAGVGAGTAEAPQMSRVGCTTNTTSDPSNSGCSTGSSGRHCSLKVKHWHLVWVCTG